MLTTKKSLAIVAVVFMATTVTLSSSKHNSGSKISREYPTPIKIRCLSLGEFKEKLPKIQNAVVLFKPDDDQYKALLGSLKQESVNGALKAAVNAVLNALEHSERSQSQEEALSESSLRELVNHFSKAAARTALVAEKKTEAAVQVLARKKSKSKKSKQKKRVKRQGTELKKEALEVVEAWVEAEEIKLAAKNSIMTFERRLQTEEERKTPSRESDLRISTSMKLNPMINEAISAMREEKSQFTTAPKKGFKSKFRVKISEKQVEKAFKTLILIPLIKSFTKFIFGGPARLKSEASSPLKVGNLPSIFSEPVFTRALAASTLYEIKRLFKNGSGRGIQHYLKSKNKSIKSATKMLYEAIKGADVQALEDYRAKEPDLAKVIERMGYSIQTEAQKIIDDRGSLKNEDDRTIFFSQSGYYSKLYQRIMSYVYLSSKFRELNFSADRTIQKAVREIQVKKDSGCEVEIYVVKLDLEDRIPKSLAVKECPDSDLY